MTLASLKYATQEMYKVGVHHGKCFAAENMIHEYMQS